MCPTLGVGPLGNVSGGGFSWRSEMPVPKHVRITFRGTILGTPETWSTGTKFDASAGGNPDGHAADVDLQACADAWGGLVNSALAAPNAFRLDDVRAYDIGTTGRMVGNPEILDVSAQNIKGVAAIRYPPQIA